jgi:hypothetical protein
MALKTVTQFTGELLKQFPDTHNISNHSHYLRIEIAGLLDLTNGSSGIVRSNYMRVNIGNLSSSFTEAANLVSNEQNNNVGFMSNSI